MKEGECMKKTIKAFVMIFVMALCITMVSPASETKGASAIGLSKKRETIRAHQTMKLKLKNAKAKKVKWYSSSKKIAAVNKNGLVSAFKKGNVRITAKYKGKKYYCRIKVKRALRVPAKSIGGSTLLQSEYLIDRLYKKDNIIISPASLNMVIGMRANGAGSLAKKDCETYLGKPLNQYNKYSMNLMERSEQDRMLQLANGIWYREDYAIRPDFQKSVKKYYLSDVTEAPFNQETVKEINQWVYDNTEGMIPKIIDDIPKDSVAIIANTLLFQGKWTTPFKSSYTFKEKFTSINDVKTKVDMMHSWEKIYYENDYATGFEKTYGKNRRYSFIAILPKVKGEFELSNLDVKNFLKTKTKKYNVNVSMPKFTYNWDGSLGNVLEKSGIKSLFNDKNNMFMTPYSLSESDILQSCKIIVDEEGTKAAAVTALIEKTSVPGGKRKTVKLNRPFGYIIRDNITGEVLFMGKVVNM